MTVSEKGLRIVPGYPRGIAWAGIRRDPPATVSRRCSRTELPSTIVFEPESAAALRDETTCHKHEAPSV